MVTKKSENSALSLLHKAKPSQEKLDELGLKRTEAYVLDSKVKVTEKSPEALRQKLCRERKKEKKKAEGIQSEEFSNYANPATYLPVEIPASLTARQKRLIALGEQVETLTGLKRLIFKTLLN